MSTTTLQVQEQATTTTHGTPERNHPLRLGTFADGQRAVEVTVTYSPRTGSFGDVERR